MDHLIKKHSSLLYFYMKAEVHKEDSVGTYEFITTIGQGRIFIIRKDASSI